MLRGGRLQAAVVAVPAEVGPETKAATFALFGEVLKMTAGPQVRRRDAANPTRIL